ncbi:MAG: hypothetical protein BHV99_06270 [Clostridium sp. 26_21]|nr:MAG: hypothetical protein BHV99_06270 [Clostridium sp. 26_21]
MKTKIVPILLILFIIILTCGIKISYAQTKETVEVKAKMYIDNPENKDTQITSKYKIDGWVMSNDNKIQIKIFVDNNEQKVENLKRVERPDVIKAIKGYGTQKENPKPGFEFYLNTNNIKDGKHILKIQILSNDNKLLVEENKNIVIKKYNAQTYIDYPTNDKVIKNMTVEGWVMTDDEKSEIKAYIDGKEQTIQNLERIERKDVIEAIKGYSAEGINKLPGYKCNIELGKISKGKHEIVTKIVSREGIILAEHNQKFILEDEKARMYIDYPDTNERKITAKTKIEGWFKSNDKSAKLKVYIDNKEIENQEYIRVKRPDVLKAITECGTEKENPKPGFELYLNSNDIKDGKHTLKIEIISSNGKKLAEETKKINYERYIATSYIDSPEPNQNIKNNLKIRGWLMCTEKNTGVKIYIDDKELTDVKIEREDRPDVLKAINGYGTEKENPQPGFKSEINISNLKDGEHTLKIVITVGEKISKYIQTQKFYLKKYNTQMYWDEPDYTETKANEITIRGWVMSELADKEIIVKFDDKKIDNITLEKRNDVIKAIKGSGTVKENPNPGFKAKLNVKSYTKGNHTIKVQVLSKNNNEIIEEYKKEILLGEKIERKIIKYGYSGAYLRGVSNETELICYKFGYGPNVLFATFCVHGFEDSWDRDGGVLVDTANAFYERLIKDADQELASKWTIYLFPEVNPDGRKLGTSNMGPGRRTLYSKADKGIDINRCWQTGSEYQRFTDSRRYNGTEGFQAYEAEYLRDFMLTHKSTKGQNVVIDLHGWEDQLIGDESICKYYKEQYPSCRTTGYGRYGEQYLISWARLNLNAKVALVELPYATGYVQVNKMGLMQKYINATLNYLKGI